MLIVKVSIATKKQMNKSNQTHQRLMQNLWRWIRTKQSEPVKLVFVMYLMLPMGLKYLVEVILELMILLMHKTNRGRYLQTKKKENEGKG